MSLSLPILNHLITEKIENLENKLDSFIEKQDKLLDIVTLHEIEILNIKKTDNQVLPPGLITNSSEIKITQLIKKNSELLETIKKQELEILNLKIPNKSSKLPKVLSQATVHTDNENKWTVVTRKGGGSGVQ